MNEQGWRKLHNAVAVLERRAIEDWRRKHHPSLTLEDAVAASIKIMETTITSKPGGLTSVTFSVVARRLQECTVEYFSLQRRENRWYEQVLAPQSLGLELPKT